MSELPEIVQSWIGKRRHEEEGEIDVERGFVLAGCSSVENSNPIYWEEDAANDITNGCVAAKPFSISSIHNTAGARDSAT